MNRIILFLFWASAVGIPPQLEALTLSQLRTESRTLALDSGSTRQRYADARINSWLNEAQKIAVMDAKPIFKSAQFELVTGTTFYSLPSDFLQMYRLSYKQETLPEATPESLDRATRWPETTARPTHYFIQFASRTKVGMYPFPSDSSSTGTIRYEYFAQSTDMSSDSDSPFNGITELSPYHYTLAYFAAAQMTAIDGRSDLASIYFAQFKAGVDRLNRESNLRPSYRPQASGARRE